MTRSRDAGCEAARESIHLRLDGELPDVAAEALEAHLASCAACRGFATELRAIQDGLRALPRLGMSDAALEDVWQRTAAARRVRPWRLAAAAAAVGIVLGGLWLQRDGDAAAPTALELEQAGRDARVVLRLAAQALRRTEHAAFREVLAEEVSGTLRRVPIQWPAHGAAERGGS